MQRRAGRLNILQAIRTCRRGLADRWRVVASVRRAGSPDLHQAKMRFLVLAGCVIYGVLIGVFESRLTAQQGLIFTLDAFLFGLFALHTHAYFKRNPGPEYVRRTIGLFADHLAALGCLAVTGRDAGALAWLPLFIIQGVGIRFGVRWLFASQAIGLASIGIVCAVNPFFRSNFTVALGAVLSMLVLPLYFALLAQREARIKAALEEARLTAEAANEAKGRFVAMISHELRTPLTGISGLNELLRKQDLPVLSQQMLAEQHAATSLVLTMVNDVLDLSKVEAGQMQKHEASFDPQELAVSVLQALSFQAKQKGLEVRTELDATVPVSLFGSPFHVTRILQNLLGNAIKFTSAGSVTLRIKLVSAPADDGVVTVQFEVIDTGIGIPPDALPKIFDRFYQVDAAVTRRFGGTGLGTSLVKEFCDLLEGSVRLESEVGEGTHCFVSLPFRRPSPSRQDAPVVNLSGTAVAAWPAHIAGWSNLKACLMSAGVSVHEISDQPPFEHAAQHGMDPSTVLVLGTAPTAQARRSAARLGLVDPPCILVGERELPQRSGDPGFTRVVIGARPDAFIINALRLATLGSGSLAVNATEPVLRQPPSGAAGSTPVRVLVAEDTPTIQYFMRATLESAGFAVTVAADGEEALSQAMRSSFDVVVLDWNMPKLDGIGVLWRLRREHGPNSQTPVVIATAAPSQELVDLALAAGALSILAKPFAGDALVRAVNSATSVVDQRSVDITEEEAQDAGLSAEVTLVLDTVALEASGSVFRTVDPATLMSVFARDVTQNKALLQRAAAHGDIGVFRSAVHSLSGYAGVLGARRLQWLLATAPKDAAELESRGPSAAAELCQTLDRTCQELYEWVKGALVHGSST